LHTAIRLNEQVVHVHTAAPRSYVYFEFWAASINATGTLTYNQLSSLIPAVVAIVSTDVAPSLTVLTALHPANGLRFCCCNSVAF
jgi:hypothetical protein